MGEKCLAEKGTIGREETGVRFDQIPDMYTLYTVSPLVIFISILYIQALLSSCLNKNYMHLRNSQTIKNYLLFLGRT